MKPSDPKIKLKKAIRYYGSQAELARVLGVHRQAVNNWPENGFIPPLQAWRLKDLNPKLFKDSSETA